jgi:hypothetical protein
MLLKLKSILRNTQAYDVYNWLRYRLEWLKYVAGYLDRAPHLLKRRLIASRARDFRPEVFVETGTLFGDMIYAQRNNFRQLYSIELDDYLFERAHRRFKRHPQIRILHGDSGQKITEVLKELDRPCLFWLDAHYSGGITAHGAEMTPVFDEIVHILHHPVKSHVIVIDDARLFNGTDGYPTFRALRDFVDSIDRGCLTWIENDTITIARSA